MRAPAGEAAPKIRTGEPNLLAPAPAWDQGEAAPLPDDDRREQPAAPAGADEAGTAPGDPAGDDAVAATLAQQASAGEAPDPAVRASMLQKKDDVFPDINNDKLNEFFYYAVRVTVEKLIHTQAAQQLMHKLAQQAGLQMYQLMLGYDTATERWVNLRPDASYRHLIWAIPLCNRKKRIDGAALAAIVTIFQDAMRTIGGVAEFVSHADIQERLEQVDEFCNFVDHKVSLHLLADRKDQGIPRRCGDIISLALSEKMEEIDGKLLRMASGEIWFRLYAGNGEEIVAKSPDRKLASLILEMDFPHVSNTDSALQEMFTLAGKLARVLGFRLVDTQHQAIDEARISELQEGIRELRAYMQDWGVRPGSKLARALFS